MHKGEQRIDIVLFIAVILLMFIGVWLVFSSTVYIADLKSGSPTYFLERHLLKLVIGILAMIIVTAVFDYKKLREYAFYIFIASLVLLILVLIFGNGGTRRWLSIGPMSFQVSELAKLALVIYLSYLIEKNRERLLDFKFGFLPLFLIIMTVSFLVVLQKSFTMAFLIFSIGMILIFLGGAKMKHILIVMIPSFLFMGLMILLEPYRLQRIIVGSGHHQAVQALIGLGNGGLFGTGIGQSRQREFFLPLSYNDYIFSILGEEYGFVGSLFLIFIFFVLFYRGMMISKYATDEFGRLLASGITFMIFLTAVLHIGVVVGILPPTGIPLPFVSYGGSAMFVNCIGAGILLNISKKRVN